MNCDGYRHIENRRIVIGFATAAVGRETGGCLSYSCQNNLQQIASDAMRIGGTVGDRVFNKEQEREADYLAAYILNWAGYDLEKSRTMVLRIGAMSDEKKTQFWHTHPAGPERLANYDKFVESIQNDPDGLPGKKQIKEGNSATTSNSPVDRSDNGNEDFNAKEIDPKKCRFYLPSENICIY